MGGRRPFLRKDRLGKQIHRAIAETIQFKSREPVLQRVTITDVDLTTDLSLARVYFYAPEASVSEATEALTRATGFIRTQVSGAIHARTTPELRFIYDDSIETGNRIEHLLSQIDIPSDGDDSDNQ